MPLSNQRIQRKQRLPNLIDRNWNAKDLSAYVLFGYLLNQLNSDIHQDSRLSNGFRSLFIESEPTPQNSQFQTSEPLSENAAPIVEKLKSAKCISFGSQFDPIAKHNIDTTLKLESRINVLVEQAEHEDYSMSNLSYLAFQSFFTERPRLRYERLFLLENGNLRATWSDEKRNHVALEFIDNQTIGFVIFKRRSPHSPVSRLSGFDTIEGVNKLISAYDLGDLLLV